MKPTLVGLLLAVLSTAFIGASFVVKKVGLIQSELSEPDHAYACLRNRVWWAGTILMGIGEVANFAAYSFASALLVTPMGCLSVVISALLASVVLNERLSTNGKFGCLLCILGSVALALYVPEERELQSIDEITHLILAPGFVAYSAVVMLYLILATWKLAPRWGRRYMIVYVSMCSFAGSLSVVGCKGLGIALRLATHDTAQLYRPMTHVFVVVIAASVVYQLTYLNRALDVYSASTVSPVYYVCFTTVTITADIILFQGLGEADAMTIVAQALGFVTMCFGVALLHGDQGKPVPKADEFKTGALPMALVEVSA